MERAVSTLAGTRPRHRAPESLDEKWLRRCHLPGMLTEADWQRLRLDPVAALADAWSHDDEGHAGRRLLLAGWFMLDPTAADAWAKAHEGLVARIDREAAMAMGCLCRPGGFEEFKDVIRREGLDGPGRTWRESGTGLALFAVYHPCAETQREMLNLFAEEPGYADRYAYAMPSDPLALTTLDYLQDKGVDFDDFIMAGYTPFSAWFNRSPAVTLDWLYRREPEQFDDVAEFHLKHFEGDSQQRGQVREWLRRTIGDPTKRDELESLMAPDHPPK